MTKTRIYDLNNYDYSPRHGMYAGNSGDKDGLLINGENWIIKYPKSTRGFTNVGTLSYTTSPLSEYLGSHIYQILGYPVHRTVLGIREGQVVVGCKDFCKDGENLVEFRQLKNARNHELREELDKSSLTETKEGQHLTNLDHIIIHLRHNPLLTRVDGITQRFWSCAIIDGLINNTDRNSGNWGIIRSRSGDKLAPVYDNGSSFYPSVGESKLEHRLNDPRLLRDASLGSRTVYTFDNEHALMFRDLVSMDNADMQQALIRNVPLIQEKMPEIIEFIQNVPVAVHDNDHSYNIMSDIRKQAYIQDMQMRLDKVMIPAYEKIKNITQEKIVSVPKQTKYNHDDDFER